MHDAFAVSREMPEALRHPRIVPTRVPTPNLLATSELKLRKRLGGTYKVQARVLQETIE